MGLQKEKDELQKDFLEKDEECMKLYISLTDKEQICAEMTGTMEEFKEDIKRLQRLVQEKEDALGKRKAWMRAPSKMFFLKHQSWKARKRNVQKRKKKRKESQTKIFCWKRNSRRHKPRWNYSQGKKRISLLRRKT